MKKNLVMTILFCLTLLAMSFGVYGMVNSKSLEKKLLEENNKILEAEKINEELQKQCEQLKKEIENLKEENEKLKTEDLVNSPFYKKIEDYLGKDISKVGMAYYDINSGRGFSINGDKVFKAASTMKVPLNIIYYDLVCKGEIDLDEQLTYTSDCYEVGTGIIQGEKPGKKYTIKTLLDYAILYSDNIATNMLYKRIGIENAREQYNKLTGIDMDTGGNYTSANFQMQFFKKLIKNPDNNPYYEDIITNMKNVPSHNRISRYIPREIVAHKVGDYSVYAHDTAIIYTKNPYIIMVYTENLSNAYEKIGQVSKIIYEYQINLK